MADTLTTTIGLLDVVATYDGAGNATGLAVRYIRTVTDQTTGAVYTMTRGPFQLSVQTYATVLTALANAMPGPGQGT